MIKKILPDFIAIALFAVLSFTYFFPAALEGRILFQHDSSGGVGAGQEAIEYYEQTGERTRWTNSLFGGMPTYQISPSYDTTQPLNWLERAYRLFLPEYVQLTFILILGFYILMRAFGLSVWLSALGGIIWAFSSYFFILISAGHIWKFITLAYIPPTIAGMVLVYRGKWLWGGLLTALFVALQIKSNHVQMSYYFLFVMLFMAIAYGIEAWKNKQMPHFWKATAILFVAGLIGVAANLSNLYHTYTYSKETMRGKSELIYEGDAAQQTSSGLDRDYITQWSYGIGETWTLLVPNFKGGASEPLAANDIAMKKANPLYNNIYTQLTQYFGEQPMTSGPVYVGAFVLFLFILGCFIVKGPMKWALLGATLFSILLSWGKNFMPLTDFFIDYVPMYNKFRAVSSILVIAEFTIPVLAIFALKRILDEPETIKKERNAFIISTTLTLGIAIIIWLWPSFLGNQFIPTQEMMMLQNALAGNNLAPLLENMSNMRAAMVSADALRSALFIAIGLVVLTLFIKGKLNKAYTIGIVALLCLVDMWGVNKRYLNDEQFVPKSIKQTSFTQTPADKYILQDKDLDYRVLNLTGSTFNENNTSYWHKSIGGYHAAKLRRYQEMIEHHISPEINAAYEEIAKAGGAMDSVNASKFNVLNMLNTKYFIIPTGRNGESIPIQNPYAYGNAWFVKHVDFVENANQEIEALYNINPHETAVVDKQFTKELKDKTTYNIDTLSTIKLTSYQPNHLIYETNNSNEGVTIFSEIYYPDGWRVTIDGEPTTLARANYILRALYLPAGKHVVEMKFDPQSLHVTEGIAYGALILLLIGVIVAVYLSIKQQKTAPTFTSKSGLSQ